MYQTPAQPPSSVQELGSAVQHDLEIAQAANTSLDMSLEAQYEALDDLPAQPQSSSMQPLIVGHNYQQIQQHAHETQLARQAEVDLQKQLAIAQQQQTGQQINQQLAVIHRSHPIAAITGSPASSSFDLSRELADTSPPKTPGSSPVPIGDAPGVSPIPIQNI